MTATLSHRSAESRPCLYVAIEMGWSKIKVASSDGPLQKPRLKELKARDLAGLEAEFAKARERFGLPADARCIFATRRAAMAFGCSVGWSAEAITASWWLRGA